MLTYFFNIVLVIFLSTYVESHHVQRRIVLGNGLDIREAPWGVTLHSLTRSKRSSYVCGGTIIGPNEVLTAAHCVGKKAPSTLFIRAGSSDKYYGGTIHNVEDTSIHPEYKSTACKIQHDVAFVRVKQPFYFNEYVQSIELAKSDPENGEYVTIAGWGKINPFHNNYPSYSRFLNYINIAVWHKDTCFENFRVPDILIYENDTLCVSNMNVGGYEAICDGDSGSPVVMNNKLVGVVSAYITDTIQLPPERECGPLLDEEKKLLVCNDDKTVGVYNSVVPHRDWIYQLLSESRKKTNEGYN